MKAMHLYLKKLTQESVADHVFEDTANLWFFPLKQYDIAYGQEFTYNAAFFQSKIFLLI